MSKPKPEVRIEQFDGWTNLELWQGDKKLAVLSSSPSGIDDKERLAEMLTRATDIDEVQSVVAALQKKIDENCDEFEVDTPQAWFSWTQYTTTVGIDDFTLWDNQNALCALHEDALWKEFTDVVYKHYAIIHPEAEE